MANIIGKRIYFIKDTGEIAYETQDRIGIERDTTVEEDFKHSKRLKELDKKEVDYIQLAYKELDELLVLNNANTYAVDPETKKLVFTNVDENGEEIKDKFIDTKEIVEVINNSKREIKTEIEIAKLERDEAIAEVIDIVLGGGLNEEI